MNLRGGLTPANGPTENHPHLENHQSRGADIVSDSGKLQGGNGEQNFATVAP